jgi:hypothetical protein
VDGGLEPAILASIRRGESGIGKKTGHGERLRPGEAYAAAPSSGTSRLSSS